MPASRLVGEAYILMRADGRLLKRDMSKSGSEGGKAWRESFDDEMKATADSMEKRFRKAVVDSFTGNDFSQFRKEFGSVENTVDGLRKKLRALTFDPNGKVLPLKDRQLLKKTYDDIVKSLEAWGDAELELEAKQQRSLDTNKRITQMFREQNAGLKVLNANRLEQVKILAKQDAITESITTKTTESVRQMERHSSAWVNNARSVRIGLDRTAERADHFGDTIGRVFGKGSRNNFLNFVGSIVGGMLRLGTAVLTFPAKAIAHVVDSFGTAFTAARQTMGFFASFGKGIGAVFGGGAGLVGVLGGAVAGFFALTKVLPSIISLLTLVGGAATALVGSIGIGLTGALLGLVPAATGAVAGLGAVFGVIAAFTQDKDNKKFWDNIFTNPFKTFAKQFYPQVRTFLTTLKTGFARLLTDITPAVESFFSSFQKAFADPASQSALDKWSTSLGKIATSINNAVVGFGDGFIGFFVPVLPYAERLANYIEDIASRFSDWANSAEGQNAIADFMRAAWKDAKLVYDILGQIGGIFGTVFSSGDTAGATFLTGIRDKLKEINDFLKTPEGRSKLDAFFGDAKDIGLAIGDIAVDIGTIVKDFSSPEGRQGAKDIMGSISTLAGSAADIIKVTGAVSDMLSKIEEFINKVNPLTSPLKPIFEFGAKLLGKSQEFEENKPPEDPTLASPAPNLGLGGSTRPTPTAPSKPGGYTPQQQQLLAFVEQVKKDAAAGIVFKIGADDTQWKTVAKIVQDYAFYKKQVPVDGNEAAWNSVKGTVAGYAFKPKVVPIKPHGDEVYDWVARWNRLSIKTKTARINVGVSRGGGRDLTGGLQLASGGILHGPTYTHPGVLAGEAGREAYVPLDRPLSQINQSVRWLAAIAQGKAAPTAMASGGIVSPSGATVVFEAGAITTAAQDPRMVAAYVKDDLVLALSH